VQSLKLNGRPWDRAWLRHEDIANGGVLEFVMGSTPSKWGSGADALPPSMTAAGTTPAGLTDASRNAEVIALAGKASPRLFDDDAATSLPLPAQAAVDVRFRAATRVSHYTITSGGAPLPGLAWALQGRNGADSWTTLDERDAEDFKWARQLRPFRIGKPGTTGSTDCSSRTVR
jgi:hypothetical protein